MDWGTIIVQVTAIIGGLAALISILTGIYELREKRRKSRERASANAATAEPQPPLASPADARPPVEALAAAPPRRMTNLPSQLTQLIGREQELVDIETLLRSPDVRLVTLTGPAGIGKTRLALQVAAQSLNDYADGVFVVFLAPITDPGLVVATIAQTLDLREQGSKSLLDILKDYLSEKRMLLVLDNFEHLMDAAPVVAKLIAAAPKLKALVTSREVLRIYGERAFVVPPLALPDPDNFPPGANLVSTLTGYEAIRLFVARAGCQS